MQNDIIPPIALGSDGRVVVADYMKRTFAILKQSTLKGFLPRDGADFGILEGTPREWTILLTANTKQESDFDPNCISDQGKGYAGDGSYGIGQMSPGDGKENWGASLTDTIEDIKNPDKASLAIVKAHEFYIRSDGVIRGEVKHWFRDSEWRGIARLNSSYRNASETLQYLPFARDHAKEYLPPE